MCSLLKLKKSEWAYLAGLFDGEGCLKVVLRKRKKSAAFQLNLDICNTHRGVLDWVHKKLGGGVLYSTERSGKERRKFNWTLGSAPNMRHVLKGMLPFLLVKQQQALLAIAFLEKIRPQNNTRGRLLSKKEVRVRRQLLLALRRSRWRTWAAIPKKLGRIVACACGKHYKKTTGSHLYCSKRCPHRLHLNAQKRKLKRVDYGRRTCICGAEFNRISSKHRWCSHRCANREHSRKLIGYYKRHPRRESK
jgi:hypothetical protein